MFISFFEEFPATENLKKLKLVKWPTKLYLAARSLKEFNQIKSKIRNKLVKEFIYWPVLGKKEGYWISPFSQTEALGRVFNELKNQKIPVMLDLELPTTKSPGLYLTQWPHFLRNRGRIKKFIEGYPGKIYLAEYYPSGSGKESILKWLGLHFSHPQAKIIKMFYYSLHPFSKDFFIQEIQKGKKAYGSRYLLALGTLAEGIGGNEPILSPGQLKRDLELAQRCGVREVIIFRLGGLDRDYASILNDFS